MRLKQVTLPRNRGLTAVTGPIFVLPLSDNGSGAVNTTSTLNGGSATATVTRATAATCWSSAGLLLTVGTGVARSNYTELTGAQYLGYWTEEARTNTCLFGRDFTNAAWVKTTCTPALDQVGIDGVANTASSLLATAGNATVKQTLALAAVNRPFSVYIKRLVGTGNIDLAQDGATFTNQTIANDGLWHRCTLVAAQLNPVLSIRIVTNADKIAVDYAGLEDNSGGAAAWPSTPILTTTVAVTRNQDNLTYPSAGNASVTAGTMFCRTMTVSTTPNLCVQMGINDGTANNRSLLIGAAGYGANGIVTSGGAPQANVSVGAGAIGVLENNAMTWGTNNSNTFFNGTPGVQDVTVTVPASFTTIEIGNQFISNPLNGGIQNVRIWNSVLTDAQILAQV